MAKKETVKKSAASSKKLAPKTVSKATVKSAPKKSVNTRVQVQAHAVEKNSEAAAKSTAPKTRTRSLKVRKSYVLFIIAILALGALLYVGRGLFVAAVVNGQPISRISVIKETEKQSGKQALDTIVRNTLIEQEARKAN